MQRLTVLATIAVAAAALPVTYQPPVADTPIADRFRPPATPYGSGNRGVDYATAEGQPVTAAADGDVVFAGQVGGRLYAVVRHADGIRTTYGGLASLHVSRGQRVQRGERIGTATTTPGLHFGARTPAGSYLDPLTLIAGRRAWLVPDYTGRPPGNSAGPRTTRGAPTVTFRRPARGAAPG